MIRSWFLNSFVLQGISVLPDGKIILADSYYKRFLVVNNNDIIDMSISFPIAGNGPYGVTHIEKKLVAVSTSSGVQTVNIQMGTIVEKIATTGECREIAYNNGALICWVRSIDCIATASNVLCGICEVLYITKAENIWCSECDEGLCIDCNKHHSISKSSMQHNAIPIESYNKLPPTIANIVHYCPSHDMKYTNYCPHHDKLCCPACISVDHKRCTGLLLLQDVIKTAKPSALTESL
ncbi:unnamed protein product [Mytilus coruscus]|uniref:B box-type domain-containing protein n=1 Tax=Mytilus coruscus TaxID=42192 RepID=A0A6J8D975_MYTCO|nr:unnamed protein product [Mytilus coruscus]